MAERPRFHLIAAFETAAVTDLALNGFSVSLIELSYVP